MKLDRLSAMRALVEAVRTGSYSAAGQSLDLPLATVVKSIVDLEEHLRAHLLERGQRELTLTAAGRQYVASCRHLLEAIDEAEQSATAAYVEPRGELIVVAPPGLGRRLLAPAMADFFPLHPQINVRLDLRTVIPDFSGETAHIVVCIGEMSDRSLVTTKVGETRRVSVASPDYLATHGTPTTMADLQSHSCLVLDEPGANGRWTFVDGASAQISPRLIVSNADAAIDAAIAGAGIVRAHCYEVRRAEEAGELVRVLEHFEAPATPIQIVHRDAGLVPAKVRAFVEFAAPRLKARLGIGLQLVSP